MGYKTADRNQQILFGYSLDDFVEKNSKVRFILEIIDGLDLSELYENYSDQGAEYYDPKIILAIWFLAFCEGIFSSRQIEEYCKKHMDFIFISGNLRPDHSTLCRFIQRNSDLWPKYFYQILMIAQQKGLSEFKRISIDGSKIKSKSSKKQSKRETRLANYQKKIQEEIQKYQKQLAEIENLEIKEQVETELLKLKKEEVLVSERLTELQERKANLNPKDRPNHQINLREKDALMMDLGNGNGYAPGYNVQIAVDGNTHLIVACDVVQDRNDEKQFSKMHQNTEDNLGEDESRIFITDGGYTTLEQLEYAHKNGIDAYMQDPKTKNYKERTLEEFQNIEAKVKTIDFKYNEEEDIYICPAGQILRFKSAVDNKKQKGRYYYCYNCESCTIREKCFSTKEKVKRFFRDYREKHAENMRMKMETDIGKELMFLRKTTVEPVFGNIKENLSFRRFRRKGLTNTKNEFALMCIAHNINKLYKLIFYAKFGLCKTYIYYKLKTIYLERLELLVTIDSFIIQNLRRNLVCC